MPGKIQLILFVAMDDYRSTHDLDLHTLYIGHRPWTTPDSIYGHFDRASHAPSSLLINKALWTSSLTFAFLT
jgi:hypothetical protein